MTQDEIINMAREAGFVFPETQEDSFTCWWEELERFAALVAAHGREKQAVQEPVDSQDLTVAYMSGYHDGKKVAPQPVKQEQEQEPVAYTNSDQLGYLKDPLYENAPMAMWSKPFDKRINIPLYAAPVRTKDLTDDEIASIRNLYASDLYFARAVIAADREKNKCR